MLNSVMLMILTLHIRSDQQGSAGVSSVRKAGCTVLCNIMLLSRDRRRSIHHEVYRFCLGHSSGELQLNS